MKRVLSKWLLAFSLIMLMGHANAQQRYYCEVKGIEKSFTSGLKIIFDFGTEASYNMWGDLSSKLKFVVWSFSKPILLYMEEVLSFIGFSSRMQKIWNRRKRAF